MIFLFDYEFLVLLNNIKNIKFAKRNLFSAGKDNY